MTNVIIQIDALETILQSAVEAKPSPESAEVKESEQKSPCADSEETEQAKVPEYCSRFKVRDFNLSKDSKV